MEKPLNLLSGMWKLPICWAKGHAAVKFRSYDVILLAVALRTLSHAAQQILSTSEAMILSGFLAFTFVVVLST